MVPVHAIVQSLVGWKRTLAVEATSLEDVAASWCCKTTVYFGMKGFGLG